MLLNKSCKKCANIKEKSRVKIRRSKMMEPEGKKLHFYEHLIL
jgi:hypothetical protein